MIYMVETPDEERCLMLVDAFSFERAYAYACQGLGYSFDKRGQRLSGLAIPSGASGSIREWNGDYRRTFSSSGLDPAPGSYQVVLPKIPGNWNPRAVDEYHFSLSICGVDILVFYPSSTNHFQWTAFAGRNSTTTKVCAGCPLEVIAKLMQSYAVAVAMAARDIRNRTDQIKQSGQAFVHEEG